MSSEGKRQKRKNEKSKVRAGETQKAKLLALICINLKVNSGFLGRVSRITILKVKKILFAAGRRGIFVAGCHTKRMSS